MSSSCEIFETNLYRGCDDKVYQIINSDSDTMILADASEEKFSVAIRPFVDEVENMIDFSSIYHFDSIENAENFRIRIAEHLNKLENIDKTISHQKSNAKISVVKEKRINLPL